MSSKNKEKIKIVVFLIVFFLVSFLIYQQRDTLYFRSFTGQNRTKTQSNQVIQEEESQSRETKVIDFQKATSQSIEIIASDDGVSALQLLEESHELEKKEYDFGVFIEGIDGKMGNDEFFWAIYVNEEKAQTGIDQIILNKGDKLKLVYEKIEF